MFFRRLGGFAHRYRYGIIAAWLVAAAVLNVAIPQLSDVIKRDSTPFLPANSDVMQAYRAMGQKFGGQSAGGDAIVVMEDKSGLSQADFDFYATVVRRLNSDRARVPFTTDFITHPELKDAAVSKDHRAIYLFAGLKQNVGTPGAMPTRSGCATSSKPANPRVSRLT